MNYYLIASALIVACIVGMGFFRFYKLLGWEFTQRKHKKAFERTYKNCIYAANDPKRGCCDRCMYGYEEYINKTDTKWRCLMDNVNYKD